MMKRKQHTDLRTEFETTRLDQIAQQLEWREWTSALLAQRIAQLDEKLAAGEIPVLDGVVEFDGTGAEAGQYAPTSTSTSAFSSEEPDDVDSLSAFLDG